MLQDCISTPLSSDKSFGGKPALPLSARARVCDMVLPFVAELGGKLEKEIVPIGYADIKVGVSAYRCFSGAFLEDLQEAYELADRLEAKRARKAVLELLTETAQTCEKLLETKFAIAICEFALAKNLDALVKKAAAAALTTAFLDNPFRWVDIHLDGNRNQKKLSTVLYEAALSTGRLAIIHVPPVREEPRTPYRGSRRS